MPFSNKPSKESFVLYLSMMVIGGCGLAYEYTLSKMASNILGNTPQQWALIIGVMMFFMGVGSDLQKHFKDKNLIDKFVAIEALLGALGSFAPLAMLWVYGQAPDYYLLVQYFFIGSIGLLIGLEVPLLTRINQSYTSGLKANIGNVLKMDYFGALLGALCWVFVLPKFFSLVEMAFALGLITVSVALMTLICLRKLVTHRFLIASFSSVTFLFLSWSLTQANQWTSFAEQYLYRDQIIWSQTTPYQHIVLTQSPANEISCYINGHLQFNSADEFIYHENLVHPVMSIAPKKNKVLVLGGGDGLTVREVLKYPQVESITICDIDPQMTALAKENPHFTKLNQNSLQNSILTVVKNNALEPSQKEDLIVASQKSFYRGKTGQVAQVNIINLDASKFVEQISGTFDVIIMDFPDPNAPDLSKLYSKQFYELIKKKLTADGLFVQQATSPIHAKEAFLCVGRTLESAGLSALPYHDNVPSFGEWGWWMGGHQDRYSQKRLKQALANLEPLSAPTRYLTSQLVATSIVFGKEQLTSQNQDINTLGEDRIYPYYLEGWRSY